MNEVQISGNLTKLSNRRQRDRQVGHARFNHRKPESPPTSVYSVCTSEISQNLSFCALPADTSPRVYGQPHERLCSMSKKLQISEFRARFNNRTPESRGDIPRRRTPTSVFVPLIRGRLPRRQIKATADNKPCKRTEPLTTKSQKYRG